jgi:4-carboxymuconolactone decarboxylase
MKQRAFKRRLGERKPSRKGAAMATVAPETHEALWKVSSGDMDALETAVGLRELNREGSQLDPRTFALVKIATLIALDAPPASYAWQIANAVADGVTPEDILGVLRAVAPQVGGPRVVAAGPEIMLALGLSLEAEEELSLEGESE